MKILGIIKEKYRMLRDNSAAERILSILRYYFAIVALSLIYKFLFLVIDCGEAGYSIGEAIEVLYHGLPHDFAVSGYFTAIPLLMTTVSVYWNLPLKKALLVYNSIIAFAITLAFLADISLYPYWQFKLDASVLIYLDSPANAFASITVWHMLLLIVLLALFTYITYKALAIAMYGKLKKRDEFRPCTNKIVATIVSILLGGLVFLGIRGGITESTNNVGSVYHCDRHFLNDAAVNPIFSFLYTVANKDNFSEEYHFFEEDVLEKDFGGLYVKDSAITDTLLNTTRPNIITIILEGMSANLIESFGGMKGVTPNFDRISKEGILFTRCYANSYRTDRGLICALSGFPSFPKTSIMKDAKRSQTLPSLARSLKDAGYRNTFIYGGDINFTNMNGYLFSTGYGRIISDQDFTAEEKQTHRWGAGDDITFNKLYDIIMEQGEEPWHITLLTLSSHEPWEVPYNRIPDDIKANSFAFTDEQLGRFIDRFKESGKWDNTLIICIPDHSVNGYPEGIEQTDKRRNHIPLLLLGGAIKEPRQIDRLCNQSDLPATILAQLQLPIEEFRFSRNVLSPSYSTPFAYHSYNNGISLIDESGFSVYDLNSGKEIIQEPTEDGEKRLMKMKAILQTTYTDFYNR